MENPSNNFNEDQEIYNIMRLNPDMTYVKGYKNIFYEKNKDNYDNSIPNNENKSFVLNQNAPKNLSPNIVVGGQNPNNPNNFSIYDINNNKISNDGIPA